MGFEYYQGHRCQAASQRAENPSHVGQSAPRDVDRASLEGHAGSRLHQVVAIDGFAYPGLLPLIGAARVYELMQMDKKVLGGAIRLVLLEKLGRAIVTDQYPKAALEATLAEHFA